MFSFFSSFLVCISWLTRSLNISLFSVIYSFSQFTFLTLSPLAASLSLSLSLSLYLLVGFNPYGFWSVVRNKIFRDSRHFLYFSVSLVLPHYETVKFVPLPPDVGKPRSSVLMFHEAIYQGLIVCFTPLEVFPRLVCGRAKSELSTHSVSLGTPSHLRVVVSTFNQGCLPSGTSAFGVLLPVCATLQGLRHVPHWLLLSRLLLLSAPYALSSGP